MFLHNFFLQSKIWDITQSSWWKYERFERKTLPNAISIARLKTAGMQSDFVNFVAEVILWCLQEPSSNIG